MKSFLCWAGLLAGLAGVAGCGVGTPVAPQRIAAAAGGLRGTVYGGQQPVSGANIYLYAVSTTATAGKATSLLAAPGYVTTGGDGSFSITSDYSCPTGAYVYLLSTGGNPGLAANTNNAELALAAALGPCAALTASTQIIINEVTTVAAAYSFASMASSETQVGSASAAAITSAFGNAANLVDTTLGAAFTVTPTGGGVVPQAEIDSLGNALAACVNSDGTGTPCASLMSAANVSATAGTPVDTFQAALNIAQNPTANVTQVFDVSAPASPFQPSLEGPPANWTINIEYQGANAGKLSPASATLNQGGQQTFSATFTGGTALSYLWTTTATAGLLNEVGGAGQTAQTTYCSTSGQSTYISSAAPVLSAGVTDAVSVQAFAASGCTGTPLGNATAAVRTVPSTTLSTIGNVPTTMYTATVVLPSGSTLTPDALTVFDSLTQTTPLASGTFTIPSYNNGEQIVFVNAPDGTPMMMSWMDANHTTVSASTTAEVLAYIALGGAQTLDAVDRAAMIAQIPQLPGFPALAATVASELGANPDAFAQPDAAVTSAVNQLFTSVTGVTPNAKPTGVKPQDVTSDPDASTSQSGVTLSNTEPAAPYTTDVPITPWSTYLTNAYRRRTHAFVIKLKDTTNGVPTTIGTQVTDFDVPPTVGVNGGVTGALVDIVKAYFGNQPTAYAPATTDPFNLPVDSGVDSTTYQIINVGPGGSGKASPVTLTSAQSAILLTTSVNSFVSDFLVPFVNNVLMGTNEDADINANTALSGQSRSDFVLKLEQNLAAVVNQLQGEQPVLVSGDYKTAITDLLFNAGALPVVSSAITSALQSAAPSLADAEYADSAVKQFNKIMYAAGTGLQVFDSITYLSQLANSDNVDVWTVTSTPYKATLTPATTTLAGVGNVQLTANVLNVNNTPVLSYQFTLSPAAGQSLVGTLSGSGGIVPSSSGALSFCASSPIVEYANNSAAVINLTAAATDTVSVTAFVNANCVAANQLTNPISATITTNPLGTAVLTPSQSTINAGGTVQLVASYSDPKDSPAIVPGSWQWTLSAGSTTTVNGTLTGTGGSGSFCSSSPNATYTSTATLPLAGSPIDVVTVGAYKDTLCSTALPAGQLAPNRASATITTTGSPRLWVYSSTLLQSGAQVPLTASFRLGLQNANTPTPQSYLWTTSGNYGLLTLTSVSGQTLSGQTTLCSSVPQATYVSTSNLVLTSNVADTVSATPYADTNCTAAQVDGLTGTATMTIEAPPGPFVLPGQLNNVLQSGDGDFYASTSLVTCGVGAADYCTYVLQVTPQGAVNVLHTFESSQSSSVNADGQSVTALLEAADGNLYGAASSGGLSGNGTIFKLDKSGNFTLLYAFPEVVEGSTGGIPRGGHINCSNYQVSLLYGTPSGYAPNALIEAADGNLYGFAQGGYAGSDITGGTFFSISPAGTFKLLNTYRVSYQNETEIGTDPCGQPVYSSSTVYIDPVFFAYATQAPSLVQGVDGNFYAEMPSSSYGASPTYGKIFKVTPGGVTSVVQTLASDGSQGSFLNGSLVAAQQPGTFYFTTSAGAFSIANGGTIQAVSPTPPALLGIEGGDGNFYTATSTGSYSGTINELGPYGGNTILGTLTNTAPQAAVTSGSPTGSQVLAGNGNLAGGAVGYNGVLPPASATTYFLFDDATTGADAAPVQLSFPAAIAPVNQPIQLTWNVYNAFSLSAQQCHATVQGGAAGAGNWSGTQLGTMNSNNVYTGTATIVPSATGTYTYALTCGGKESGFATLSVQ